MTKSEGFAPIFEFLRQRAEESYWGNVTLKYKAGALVQIISEQSILPEQINPKDRYPHAQQPTK